MRWGRKRKGGAGDETRPGAEPLSAEEAVERELEEHGLPRELSGRLARRLAARVVELGPEAGAALVEGAVLAFAEQGAVNEGLRRNLHELREVERLMGAFSGELSKLDEVLEVLAAYVRRMRTTTPGEPVRTLH